MVFEKRKSLILGIWRSLAAILSKSVAVFLGASIAVTYNYFITNASQLV